MMVDEVGCSSMWTREQDKAFENALATYPEDGSDRWDKIASDVPGKTVEEIKHHYDLLVDDVNQIGSGCVPLPNYHSEGSTSHGSDEGTGTKGGQSGHHNGYLSHGNKTSRSDQERRKGIAWTEDEHRLFLLGLEKYGKGDWRSISRNFVVTRTPTQVASHAQKYFIRLNSMNKDRRRASIHDITSINNGDILSPQGPPITGHPNGSAAGVSSGKTAKQTSQHPAGPPGIGVYCPPTIGQPVGGPLMSAVGTPVNLPAPAHMTYGVGAPISGALPGAVPGAIVPGASMNMAPMAYHMPPTTAQR